MRHNIAAGLVDSNVEFFALPGEKIYAISCGSCIESALLPIEAKTALCAQIAHERAKISAYQAMGCVTDEQILQQYISCNYGGFDTAADVKDGILQPTEYWPCPNRGVCKWEGIGCDALKTNNGQVLTKREIEILKLVAAGNLDKEIAWLLKISVNTVSNHLSNVRGKTGLNRKAELTRFAINKNLI